MKKILALLMAVAMIASLAAASGSAFAADTQSFKIAIVKQLDHASLDEIANASRKMAELSVDLQNATDKFKI